MLSKSDPLTLIIKMQAFLRQMTLKMSTQSQNVNVPTTFVDFCPYTLLAKSSLTFSVHALEDTGYGVTDRHKAQSRC